MITKLTIGILTVSLFIGFWGLGNWTHAEMFPAKIIQLTKIVERTVYVEMPPEVITQYEFIETPRLIEVIVIKEVPCDIEIRGVTYFLNSDEEDDDDDDDDDRDEEDDEESENEETEPNWGKGGKKGKKK